MKRILLILLSIFLVNFNLRGEEIITISGRVVDSRNNSIAQVNVRAEGSSIATVTNGDGVFLLKLPLSSSGDYINFSFVGYLNKQISVQELESKRGEMVIKLSPENILIKSIDVDLKDATSYIEEVFERRSENNLKERSFQTAFYREAIKKRQSYATLAEAVVEIDKAGLRSLYGDRAAISKGRSLRDRRFTDTLFVKFQGGITSALLLDVAKNSEIVFTDKPSEEYRFWFDKPTTIDGRRVMVVAFNQKSEDPGVIDYRGLLYIDSLDMAIARVEFNRNVEDRKDAIAIFIKKRPNGLKVEALGAKYIASYRFFGGKWCFDYSSIELDFRCHYPNKLFRSNYTITSEIVVTEHGVEPKKIPYFSSVRPNDFLFDSAQEFYDEDFWESYNIIEQERSVDAVVKRFLRQLKER